MREFTFHCGASVLVDDAYATWDIKETHLYNALDKAYKHLDENPVLDTGTLDVTMDIKDLAKALGDLAAGDNEDWEPVELVSELEKIKDCYELIVTLEMIVSEANKEGKYNE